MSIYEYDEKKQRRLDREEGIEIGDGSRLIILVQKKTGAFLAMPIRSKSTQDSIIPVDKR